MNDLSTIYQRNDNPGSTFNIALLQQEESTNDPFWDWKQGANDHMMTIKVDPPGHDDQASRFCISTP